MNAIEREQFLATRRAAGLRIDPNTAEVISCFCRTSDPYGIYSDDPDICNQIGYVYFARAPSEDVWVSFDDLPKETSDALWEMTLIF